MAIASATVNPIASARRVTNLNDADCLLHKNSFDLCSKAIGLSVHVLIDTKISNYYSLLW